MRFPRSLTDFLTGAGAYIIFSYGLWEPLRSIVVGVLCVSVALAAWLAYRNRVERSDTSYLQIAWSSLAVGAGLVALRYLPLRIGDLPITASLALGSAIGAVAAAAGLVARQRADLVGTPGSYATLEAREAPRLPNEEL